MKNIVVIGGGTGTSVVLSGLKNYNVNLTAIVSMADNGGSTGRLRDEFGFQPVGDLRQSLASLAREDSQEWIRKLLLYRFSHGRGLQGHNLGNLMLTALQDMSGSTPQALEIMENMFGLKGRVYPSTSESVDLVIEFEDGTFIIGECNLNSGGVGGKKIKKVYLSPKAKAYFKALESINNADLIVIGPGDLYASIIPNFLATGMKTAIKTSRAKIIYVLNLMTCFCQTHNYKASDHVQEITNYSGRKPDCIIINNKKIENNVLKIYENENEFPVDNDLDIKKINIYKKELVLVVKTHQKGDALHRSLLRHDSKKLAKVLLTLI